MLPCKIFKSEKINLKHVFWLTINYKVVQLHILGVARISVITSLCIYH